MTITHPAFLLPEILHQIFSLLPTSSLHACLQISKLHNLISEEHLYLNPSSLIIKELELTEEEKFHSNHNGGIVHLGKMKKYKERMENLSVSLGSELGGNRRRRLVREWEIDVGGYSGEFRVGEGTVRGLLAGVGEEGEEEGREREEGRGVRKVVFRGVTNVSLRFCLDSLLPHRHSLKHLTITTESPPSFSTSPHSSLTTTYLASRLCNFPNLESLDLSHFNSPHFRSSSLFPENPTGEIRIERDTDLKWIKPSYQLQSLIVSASSLTMLDLHFLLGASSPSTLHTLALPNMFVELPSAQHPFLPTRGRERNTLKDLWGILEAFGGGLRELGLKGAWGENVVEEVRRKLKEVREKEKARGEVVVLWKKERFVV